MAMTGKNKKGRKAPKGGKLQDIKSFEKAIDVLNYCPVDYVLTDELAEICADPEKYFTEKTKGTPSDDLTLDKYVPFIKSICNKQRVFSRVQYNEHMNTIFHDKGVLKGKIAELKSNLALYMEDRDALKAEITELKELEIKNKEEILDEQYEQNEDIQPLE